MSDDLIGKWELSRRRVLAAAGGLGLAGLSGTAFGQQGGPWSAPPKTKVDRLNFVVWTYGDIYTRIAKQFEDDWGVKVDSTISSFNDHPTKLATMFAAGEKIDVSQSSPFSFPNFVSQGLVEPLDDLPGAADYIKAHVSKPVVGYVAGFTAPEGKTMGHAGAIVSGSSGTAAAKKEALEAAGVKVGKTPSETAALAREILAGL